MQAQDWRDYLTRRFGSDDRFNLQHEDDASVITDATGRSKTEIHARYFLNDRVLRFLDFLNPEAPGWNRWIMKERYHCADRIPDPQEDLCSGEFTPARLAEVEQWLAVPLYNGWTEQAYYVDGIHVVSDLRWQQAGISHERSVTIEDAGCWMGLFDLVRYRSGRLRRMESRVIVIPPIIEAA